MRFGHCSVVQNFKMSELSTKPGQRSPEKIAKSRAVIAQRRRAVAFIVAIVTSLIFAVIGGVGWLNISKDAAVMAQGHAQVTARVVEKEIRRYIRNATARVDYHVHLSFVDAEGVTHVVRKSVGAAEIYNMQEGQSLPLRYALADPTVVELREGDLGTTSRWAYWMMLGGFAGAVLLGLAGVLMGRRGRK